MKSAAADGKRRLDMLRWGLIPRWAKDPKVGPAPINARTDTVAEKPMFKGLLKSRRCIVPADGFFEWKTEAKKKLPVYFQLRDHRPFGLAGLWEQWKGPEEVIESVTLMTTEPNDLVAAIHNRMPAILPPDAYSAWLDPALTELAARAIGSLPFPPDFPVTVLFDSFYLCSNVVNAVESRGGHYIGVAKSNRRLTVEGSAGRGHRLSSYASNVLRRSGKWVSVTGLRRAHRYRVAERIGTMKKLGEVKVVFSRRRGDGAVIALVTNDLKRSPRRVVGDYLRRWSIEMLIKDEKQNLGLGDYRVLRYRAVVRHLHLVDCAYACLTHVGLDAQRAQGRKDAKSVLRLPPIRQLKQELRQMVWNEAVKDVAKVSHERAVIRRLEKLLVA